MNKADLLKKLESIKAGIDKAPADAKPLMQKAIDTIESQIAELDKEGNVKPEAKAETKTEGRAKAGRPKGTTKPKAEKVKRGRGRPAKKVVEKAPEEKPVTEVQINKVAKDIREEGEPMIRARKRAKKALTEIKEVAKETKQMESKGTLTKSKILAEIKKLNKVFANLGVDIVVESADDLFRDATRTALPKGLRVSKNGKEYYESRPNRSDSLQGTAIYPKLKLAEGGEVEKPMVGTYEGKDAIKGNVVKIGFFTAENGTHIELVGKRDSDSVTGMIFYVAINGRGLYAREYREDAYELYRDEIEKYKKKYAEGGSIDDYEDYDDYNYNVGDKLDLGSRGIKYFKQWDGEKIIVVDSRDDIDTSKGSYIYPSQIKSVLETYDDYDEYAKGGEVGKKYMVFNYTDNIYASPEVFNTKKEANEFIKSFKKRFEMQGYYRDNRMNKIDIEDIDLLVIPSDFSPYRKFAKGGELADVVVYDFGDEDESLDRYTIFTPDGSVYGMSENALGFNMYLGNDTEIEKGSHLGIKLKSVPEGIKKAVLDRMNEKYANGGGVKYPTDLKVGSVLEGIGFPMLKGLDGGNFYTIVEMDNYSATLVRSDKNGKPKSKLKSRHYLSSLESAIKTASRGDNNGLLVEKYANGGRTYSMPEEKIIS